MARNPSSRDSALRRQLRTVGPAAAVAFAAVGAVYLAGYTLALAFDRPPILITEDPASIFGGPPYTGAFQYLGFLGWWLAAVLAGVTAWLLRGRSRDDVAMPLAGFCLISTWLLVDDMFLVHESVLDEHGGVPQWVTLLVYVAVAGWFFWRVRAFLAATDWLMLALAAILFAAAGVIDQVGDVFGHDYNGPEEGLEVLGITAWTLYVARCALRYLTVDAGAT